MDVGIISALERSYRRKHIDYASDRTDLDAQDAYVVELQTALQWFNTRMVVPAPIRHFHLLP